MQAPFQLLQKPFRRKDSEIQLGWCLDPSDVKIATAIYIQQYIYVGKKDNYTQIKMINWLSFLLSQFKLFLAVCFIIISFDIWHWQVCICLLGEDNVLSAQSYTKKPNLIQDHDPTELNLFFSRGFEPKLRLLSLIFISVWYFCQFWARARKRYHKS